MIVVGITEGVNEAELERIAGNKENVFFASSFDALESGSFVDQLGGKMCSAADKPSKWTIAFIR